MKHAWTIYSPQNRAEDLRLFSSKKKAQAEWQRVYGGEIGKLLKEYAPDCARIVKVHLDV